MAKARGNRNAPQTSYTRPQRPMNPMRIDARYLTHIRPTPSSPSSPSPGFFGGLGNRMDQTVQGIGQMFGARPPQRDPSQEWITDTRPQPSMDQFPGDESDPGFYPEGRGRHTLDRLYQPGGVHDPGFYPEGRGRHTLDRQVTPEDEYPEGRGRHTLDRQVTPEDEYPTPMPRRRGVDYGQGAPPETMQAYQMSNPMSPGRNGPSSIQGVNLRTGQTQSVPISDRQASTFNDPYVGGRPAPDGSVAPVSNPPGGGLFTMNPNNVPRSPENVQRRQGIADAIGGFFTQNPNNVQRSPRSTALRQGIADFFGAQQMESPYDQNPESLGQAGFSNGATMGPQTPAYLTEGWQGPRTPTRYQVPQGAPEVDMSQMRPVRNRQTPQQRYGSQSRARAGANAAASMLMPFSPAGAIGTGSAWGEAASRSPESYTLQGQIAQSQADNPRRFAPSPDQVTDEAMRQQEVQGRRTGQFLDDNPMAGSSTDANRIARSIPTDIYNRQTAGASNGYEGNIAYVNDPDRYNPMDPRMQAIQQRNAEDQTAGRPVGRDNRWSSGAMDDYTASGGKPWYEREAEAAANSPEVLAKREQAYQNAMARERPEAKLAKYNEREARIRELQANRRSSMPPGEYDKLRAKQVDFAASKKAKEEKFIQENGMNYAQARREKTRTKHQDGRFKRDVRRGMNPMSPGAFAAHPEAGARFRNAYAQAGKGPQAQNPMRAATEAFRPEGVTTADSKVKSQGFLDTLSNGGTDPSGNPIPASPFFAGLADEQDNIQSLHFGIQEQVQNNIEPSDNDLVNLHAAAVAMQSGYGTDSYDPFDMTYGAEYSGSFGTNVDASHNEAFKPMYEELAGMENPTTGKLKEWWTRFKGRVRPDTNRFVGGSSILSGEGAPTVSPGGYEYPQQAPANPTRGR